MTWKRWRMQRLHLHLVLGLRLPLRLRLELRLPLPLRLGLRLPLPLRLGLRLPLRRCLLDLEGLWDLVGMDKVMMDKMMMDKVEMGMMDKVGMDNRLVWQPQPTTLKLNQYSKSQMKRSRIKRSSPLE